MSSTAAAQRTDVARRTETSARFAKSAPSVRYVRAHPFSLGVAVVYVVLAVATGPLAGPNQAIQEHFGMGVRPLFDAGYWWSPVTSTFLTRNLEELILVVVLAIVLLGASEKLMGIGRTALAFATTAASSTIVGTAMIVLGQRTNEYWATTVAHVVTLDPQSGIVGAIMTASAFGNVLWRRRIRVIVLLVCFVFVLYSGEPADLFRLLAAGAGLALGAILARGRTARGWTRSSHHEVRVLLAAATLIGAVGPIISLASPTRVGLLAPLGLLFSSSSDRLDRCEIYHVTSQCVSDLSIARVDGIGPLLVSVLPLLLLAVAAYGLLRGSRFAAWLAVSVNLLLGVLAGVYYGVLPIATGTTPGPLVRRHVVSTAGARSAGPAATAARLPHGGAVEVALSLSLSILLPIALALVVFAFRSRFPAKPEARTVRRYVGTVLVSFVVLSLAYVIGGLLLRTTAFTRPVGLADLLMDVVQRFVPAGFLGPQVISFLPATLAGRLLYHGVGPVFWLIVVAGALRATLGQRSGRRTRDAARARRLLQRGTGDSRSFMSTWLGNDFWFDESGQLAVAYRVVGRVALTVGGPFGTVSADRPALEGFARFCDDNGWTPVFYSTDAELGPILHRMGWHTMTVAEEAQLAPQAWTTTGKKWQDVRSSINRAERAGIRAEWTTYQSLSLSMTAQIAALSESWIAAKDLPEMGFTLGGLEELRDPAVRLMLAVDEAGRLHGVTSWLPWYREGHIEGWTLDFMRRSEDSINGVMEFLIAATATRLKAEGIASMSLSGAPLAQAVDTSDNSLGLDTVIDYLSASLEPVYGFRSLMRFKEKFQPTLRPLIMGYPDPVALPAIGIALARAYLPDLSVSRAAGLILSRG